MPGAAIVAGMIACAVPADQLRQADWLQLSNLLTRFTLNDMNDNPSGYPHKYLLHRRQLGDREHGCGQDLLGQDGRWFRWSGAQAILECAWMSKLNHTEHSEDVHIFGLLSI